MVTISVALAATISGNKNDREERIQKSRLPPVVQKTVTENVIDRKSEENWNKFKESYLLKEGLPSRLKGYVPNGFGSVKFTN